MPNKETAQGLQLSYWRLIKEEFPVNLTYMAEAYINV